MRPVVRRACDSAPRSFIRSRQQAVERKLRTKPTENRGTWTVLRFSRDRVKPYAARRGIARLRAVLGRRFPSETDRYEHHTGGRTNVS